MAGRPKTRAKKAAAEKAAAKKATPKKAAVKKAPRKKSAVKKRVIKKAPVKKTTFKKAPAKKAVAKKAASKKAPAKKAAAKKAPVKKAQARKVSTSAKSPTTGAASHKKPVKKKAGPAAIPSFVTTYIELARFLGVSRQSLNRWKKISGSPNAKSDGRHSVKEWREFMKSQDLSGQSHDLDSLKARDLLAKIEEREFKNAVKRGEYVSVEEVRLAWSSLTAKALQQLEKALCDELPPILAGMDPIEIRQKNEEQLNEVRRLLHNGEGLTP